MGKPRSGEPAKPTRRSIVELTEAARRAADDGLLPPVVIAARLDDADKLLRSGGRAIASDTTDVHTNVPPSSWPSSPAFAHELRRAEPPCRVEAEDRSRPSTSSFAADVDARQPSTPEAWPASVDVRRSFSEDGHKAGLDPSMEAVGCAGRSEPVERSVICDDPAARGEKERSSASAICELNPSDSTAEMLVKIAKACQASALDDIKTGFGAALDYAADLAEKRPSPGDASTKREPEKRDGTAAAAAADYQAEALALMKANIATTLDYTRQLMLAKSPAEFVELSSTHARKQCELVLEQTRVLRSFARTVTKSDAA